MTQQASKTGSVQWRDLMSSDVHKSKSFYTELFDWGVEPWEAGAKGPYEMFKAGDKTFGGVVELEPKDQVPTHWINYLSVADVDATCASAKELGGKVLVEPFDIPKVGRTAVLADPGGATFSPFQAADPESDSSAGEPADFEFCWTELMTNEVDQAVEFYQKLFGWSVDPMPMGELTGYVFKIGERMVGSLRPTAKDCEAPNYWLNYVLVPSVDDWYAKAGKLGAEQIHGPTDAPPLGRFAVLKDPSGGIFALWKNAAQAG